MGKNTIYNRLTRCTSRINDLIYMCKIQKWSSDELNKRWIDILNSEDYTKLPRYEKGFLIGVYDTACKYGINPLIAYGYFLDDQFLECRSQAIEGKHQLITELNLPCVAVWREDPSKIWFVSKDEK